MRVMNFSAAKSASELVYEHFISIIQISKLKKKITHQQLNYKYPLQFTKSFVDNNKVLSGK